MESIFQKNFDSITSTDIQNLIDIKYKERQRMEYKREMYGRSNEEKKEMLKDISSMANAYGGYLIIGVEEDNNGIPIKPFNVNDVESERNRIEQLCLSSIEPRISGLKCKTVTLDSGENVIVVLIPRSLKKPHMVTFSGLNQFWIRHNDKKFPMSVEEIREACVSAVNVWKDVRQFLDEREAELKQQITKRGGIVIGCSPALTREEFIDIKDSSIKNFLINPPNQVGKSFNLSFKKGDIILTDPEPTLFGLRIGKSDDRVVQLFRNGYYELIVDRNLISIQVEHKEVFINTQSLVGHTVNYFRALNYLVEQFGFESNIVAFVNLYNIENIILEAKVVDPDTESEQAGKKRLEGIQHLLIPPRQIISFDNPDAIAKSFLEKIWNAFGVEDVPFFRGDEYNP